MRLFIKYFSLSFIILLTGYGNVQADTGESRSSKEDSEMSKEKKDFKEQKDVSDDGEMSTEQKGIIIDVREDKEWKEHAVPGAFHIPRSQLNGRLSELKQFKDLPVITNCEFGTGCSEQVYYALKNAGFTKVYNIERGVIASER